jgi:O-antigen/teichoic acid export membrane protein
VTQMAVTEVLPVVRNGGPEKKAFDQEGRRFVRNNALTTASTLLAGLLGFGLQAVTSHVLHPRQFGAAFSVITLYALLTRPAAAFGRLVAWQTSRERTAAGDGQPPTDVLREVVTKMLLVGAVAGALFCAGAWIVGRFFHVPASYILVSSAGMPFMLAVQPLLGRLQGQERFVSWGVISIWVIASRPLFVVPLVFVDGGFGVLLGTTLAAAATFVVAIVPVWSDMWAVKGRHSAYPVTPFRWGAVVPLVMTGVASTLAVGVFLGADVIIVEHFFDKLQGGQYSAVSAAGNAVFFATGGVAAVIFPIVAARHAGDRSTFGVMGASLGMCALAMLAGTLFFQLFGKWVLTEFAGRRFAAGDHYLGLYVLGMGLLGCLVVLLNTQQSLNRMSLLWVLIPFTILRPVLLLLFHHTLMTVVVVSDVCVAAFALIIGVMYVISERARQRSTKERLVEPAVPPAPGAAAAVAAPG